MEIINVMKKVQEITLYGRPPLLTPVFNLLVQAGARHFALFGGAVRDADYAARHGEIRPIKDYDLRVWLPEDKEAGFVRSLGENVRLTPSAGTGRIRYCLDFMGAELDISVRTFPSVDYPAEAVAQDRAADADIGLCSVAIDSLGRAWATAEYIADRDGRTLSVYPSSDVARMRAYTQRMQTKFPGHTIIAL